MSEDKLAETQAPSNNQSPIKYFISGGFGGICTVIVGHPFDTIKVRLQTNSSYTGMMDCASKTIKKEGVRGLYKGMSAPIAGVAPIFAISFFGFGVGKKLLQQEDKPLDNARLFAAGAFSGIFTTSVMAPGERIKCLLQVQQGSGGEQKYKGMIDCAKQLYKEGGIRSIYKGSLATLLRDVPASGMYFLTYEFIKKKVAESVPEGEKLTPTREFLGTIFAGGMAGVANWSVGMPQDVLKSRLQTAPEGMYTGMGDVFRQLMKNEGPLALYKGFAPVMARAVPANAACFIGLELCMRFLNNVAPNL